MNVENVNAKTPDSKRVVKDLGFVNHGLVIRDGAGKVLFKQADHSVEMQDVRNAIKNLVSDSDAS